LNNLLSRARLAQKIRPKRRAAVRRSSSSLLVSACSIRRSSSLSTFWSWKVDSATRFSQSLLRAIRYSMSRRTNAARRKSGRATASRTACANLSACASRSGVSPSGTISAPQSKL
jgi:hypothetical protein